MYTKKVSSKRDAKRIATRLIDSSVRYEVTPLPEDEYEFGVRRDVAHVLDKIFIDLIVKDL